MAGKETHPGVYIEEIPSGAHAIAGVATSITAFVGRTAMGPVDEPLPIFTFGDYQRFYGGLSFAYPVSYAVRDFFLNGGSQAVIVRLTTAGSSGSGAAATAIADAGGGITLTAANPGSWANTGPVSPPRQPSGLQASFQAVNAASMKPQFNLTVVYQPADGPSIVERFANLTLTEDSDPNRIDRVLKDQSNLVRATVAQKAGTPQATAISFRGGADGGALTATDYQGNEDAKTGLYQLDKVDLFNILCIPADKHEGDTDPSVYRAALQYCFNRRAMLIVDPPVAWKNHFQQGDIASIRLADLNLNGEETRNAVVYFPRLIESDSTMNNQQVSSVPCGTVAGVWASTDRSRGVWKAPAGLEAGLNGITKLECTITDTQNGDLNVLGINCLREFPVIGPVVWGSRTLRGADVLQDDYKYVNVRRLALYIEESLYRGTKFAVFETNGETLWASLRLTVNAFMANLSRQGAFYDFKVVCDATTTTQSDIDQGIVRMLVAFAPVKPAEFIILEIQQIAGKTAAS